MATINVDELREYLRDYYGTAMMGGFWPAVIDLGSIDSMDGQELCKLAKDMGVDLRKFVVSD